MKYIFSFIFLCVIFHCILANEDRKQILKKMNRAALTLRNIVKAKEAKMRKLQNTQEPDFTVNTIPANIPPNSKTIQRESYDSVPTVPAVSTGETNSTSAQSEFKVKKFHGFRQLSRRLQFGLFTSFLDKEIVRTIVMRILVTYGSSRLRNLPMKTKAPGASIPTICEIKDKSLEGKVGTGQNVDYDCTGEAPEGAGDITDAVIDTRAPMYVGDEKTEISEISFSSDSGVGNIANAKQVAIVLDKTTANAGDNKLTLSGYATPIEEARENIKKGNTYNMKFYDVSTDEMKEVPCTVTVFQDGVGESIPCTLECNTASKPIETYVGNLTQASIDEDKVFYLTVNPDLSSQPPNTLLTPSGSSSGGRTFYRKDSSGLSGGAIAGIVIACVVVLAAASIAALMLRKTDPTVDQTTVVKLRPYENA
jgi:hypothetical protein